MPVVESHQPGSFCWVELGAADRAAAKDFYSSLFGWTCADQVMDAGIVYTIFALDGRDVAGLYELDPRQHLGVPPHWMLFVRVEDADAAAARTAELGGNVIVDPYDVFDLGRLASLQDPSGAYFCVWQPNRHPGIGVAGVPSTLCWSELVTPAPLRARDFYGQLFGWGLKESDGGYTELLNGGEAIGGILEAPETGEAPKPHWMPYFLAADADAVAGKARGLGATWKLPPSDLPNVGRYAVIADPQGAVFAIVQIARK